MTEIYQPTFEENNNYEGENDVSLQVNGYLEKLSESADVDKDRRMVVVDQVLKYVRFATTSLEVGVKNFKDLNAIESLIDSCESMSGDLGFNTKIDIDNVRKLSAEARERIADIDSDSVAS